MAFIELIDRQIANLERQKERLLEREAKFGEIRNLDNGEVIGFQYRFAGGSRVYDYAAIKTADLWYTTGPASPKGYTDDDLIRWLSESTIDPELFWATRWDRI